MTRNSPTDTLEPKNGDFVSYLKDLESEQKKDLKGLHITLPEDQNGMVKVSSSQELSAQRQTGSYDPLTYDPAAAQKASAAQNALAKAKLMGIAAGPLWLGGMILMACGMIEPELNFLMPFGMVMLFAGVVLSAESKKRVKKMQRQLSDKS